MDNIKKINNYINITIVTLLGLIYKCFTLQMICHHILYFSTVAGNCHGGHVTTLDDMGRGQEPSTS
jgi:hypothetical protein